MNSSPGRRDLDDAVEAQHPARVGAGEPTEQVPAAVPHDDGPRVEHELGAGAVVDAQLLARLARLRDRRGQRGVRHRGGVARVLRLHAPHRLGRCGGRAAGSTRMILPSADAAG